MVQRSDESTQRTRLSADDWADAALAALRRGGTPAVAVEPLARTLGATKGSFYWHFRNRRELVDAALALWERRQTDAFIDHAQRGATPRERLLLLFDHGLGSDGAHENEAGLHADLHDPQVAATVTRVGARRVDYVREQLLADGMPDDEADRRAHLVYALALGLDAAGQTHPVRGRHERAAWTASILQMALGSLDDPEG